MVFRTTLFTFLIWAVHGHWHCLDVRIARLSTESCLIMPADVFLSPFIINGTFEMLNWSLILWASPHPPNSYAASDWTPINCRDWNTVPFLVLLLPPDILHLSHWHGCNLEKMQCQMKWYWLVFSLDVKFLCKYLKYFTDFCSFHWHSKQY